MIKNKKLIAAAVSALFAISTITAEAQQLKTPAPSPLQTIDQSFALSNIKIEYSRPSAKGRTIYGDLVPFAKIWRTGANNATKITFGEDVTIEGMPLAAGTYALYTIPNKDVWEVLFYKDLQLGGDVAKYVADNEVLRVKVLPSSLANKVETFTINIADLTANSATVELLWEQTRAAFKVAADIDSKIMKNIEASLATDSRPYFQAANYYYENQKDMKQALDWAKKAAEINPKAFWILHLQAKIQLKLKDNQGAIATAEKSMALAKEAKNDDYVALNEKLIAGAKKGI